ncbi:hypothetical protein EON66_09970, partial [archaeon]
MWTFAQRQVQDWLPVRHHCHPVSAAPAALNDNAGCRHALHSAGCNLSTSAHATPSTGDDTRRRMSGSEFEATLQHFGWRGFLFPAHTPAEMCLELSDALHGVTELATANLSTPPSGCPTPQASTRVHPLLHSFADVVEGVARTASLRSPHVSFNDVQLAAIATHLLLDCDDERMRALIPPPHRVAGRSHAWSRSGYSSPAVWLSRLPLPHEARAALQPMPAWLSASLAAQSMGVRLLAS